MKVLVVEDDPCQLEYLKHIVEDVYPAYDVEYKRLAENSTESYADIAILDCNMKEGCTGIELASQLKAANKDCVIVFYSVVEQGKKYMDMSMSGYDVLSKQLTKNDLVECLKLAAHEALKRVQ